MVVEKHFGTVRIAKRILLAVCILAGPSATLNEPLFSQDSDQKSGDDQPIDFSLQVRPILSEHCFHCHGPDAAHREADLRLDDQESAKHVLDQLIERIESDDPDRVMPPPSARKTVTDEQRNTLRRWINQGAPWGKHWSLEPPRRHPLASMDDLRTRDADPPLGHWTSSPIDRWVLQRMQSKGLSPAHPADPNTLARRLWLDLVGLHPDLPRVERFVQEFQQDRVRAIESMVDELLEHPGFGEHWARLWLDLARYADTKGYEKDLKRDLWPYRDWVIQALNDDMPYDQFTIEQLAGDLLENPTTSQRIATAFHRATLSNDEGGTDDEEFRVAAVKDRVDTTLQVWMGLTMGCAKCHTHKYDPISIEDYYKFFAIFNQTEDADRYDDEPRIPIPSFKQQHQLAQLEDQRRQIVIDLNHSKEQTRKIVEDRWITPKPISTNSESSAPLVVQDDYSILAVADRPATDVYEVEVELPSGQYKYLKLDALLAKANPSDPAPRLGLSESDPNFVLNDFEVSLNSPTRQNELTIIPLKASFEQKGWALKGSVDEDPKTGWAVSPKQHQEHWGLFEFAETLVLPKPAALRFKLVQSFGGHLLLHRFKVSIASPTNEDLVVDDQASVQQIARRLQEIDQQIQALKDTIPKLPILKELGPKNQRTTRIHKRGSFLDPGEQVTASVIPLFESQTPVATMDRLTAARWLVDPNNPLTARVAVNRVWAQLFGRGIVETEEDFGATGALPSHPELLDWLALEYRDSMGWSLKSLIRTIVLSSTYQQSYVMDPLRAQRDPQNVWLSRGSHFRLSAEVIRDQALGAAGLLSKKLGGPPVMPPQPQGLWRSTYSGANWVTSPGEDRFRRGIYTFWKRTTPYPSMEIFDATTREVCQIRRITTNTPLQALVTLNDPVYVEASIAMAAAWLSQSHSDIDRIRKGFESLMIRPIETPELDRLEKLLERARTYFKESPDAAKALLSDYPLELDKDLDPKEIAAWSMLTSTLLNLDEFLTRP